METLMVKTVPARDLDNPDKLHTAYTVYKEVTGSLRVSSGWMLKDAIEYYVRDYGLAREDIRLHRPFERQEDYLRRHGMYY